MRLAMEAEYIYAAEFPFVNYGIDLEVMADEEKGIRMTRLTQKPADTAHTTDKKEARDKKKGEMASWYGEMLEKLPPRAYDKIPLDFHGKGTTGYMLYDIV